MSDLRGNMIAGTVLASFLGVLGLQTVADGVYASHYPETPGLAIEVAVAPEPGQDSAPKPIDWGTVLADPAALPALIARGDQLHKACVTCHSFEPGGANGTGPALYDVVGRVSGTHGGFAYSDAMKAHAKPWTYDELAGFIAAPAAYIRGTKMAFVGYRKQEDQIAIVAFLRSLAPSPAPLPAPLPVEAAPAAAPEAPAGEAPPADPAP
jgi:cytochrome c